MPLHETLTMEHMRLLAETSAQAVGKELREALDKGFEHVEARLTQKIETEFELRFGDMKPTEHLVQHNRLHSLLEAFDGAKKSAVKTVTGAIVKYACALIISLAAMKYAGIKIPLL
jgi:preprotein translocase subunit SecA